MKTKFYWESKGEVVNQVYEVEANSFEDAKRVVFSKMNIGDVIAECTKNAVKEYSLYPEYSYLDLEACARWEKLHRGAWLTKENGEEYWENDVYYFSSEYGEVEELLDKNGDRFTAYQGYPIYCANLNPTGTTDLNGNCVEWRWTEATEMEYSEEWLCDVNGYVENLLDLSDYENLHIIDRDGEYGWVYGAIHNLPEGAVVVGENGVPKEVYFVRL
jgi:hypothetical protein